MYIIHSTVRKLCLKLSLEVKQDIPTLHVPLPLRASNFNKPVSVVLEEQDQSIGLG